MAGGGGMDGANPTAATPTGCMRLGSFDTAVATAQHAIAIRVGIQSWLPQTMHKMASIVTSSANANPPKKASMINALRTCVRCSRYSLSAVS